MGIAAGIGYAATFYLASSTFASVTAEVLIALVTEGTASPDAYNAWLFAECERMSVEFGIDQRCPRELLPTNDAWPPLMDFSWAVPIWAGLSAAMGQAVALAVWVIRPRRAQPVRARYLRSGAATGLMWNGLVPLMWGKIWLISAVLVYRANFSAAAAGYATGSDPFTGFAPWAALLVLLLALEPWRGLQRAYRCGWWPLAGLAATLALGAALYAAGSI